MFFTHIQALTIVFGRKSLQLQHYNKYYAYTEKVVTFLPNHPSIILRSSFVHPSIGHMRMIIGCSEVHSI